jgi:hypothetical protein
MREKRL